MLETEIHFKPKVPVGGHAFLIKVQQKKIHCPCCGDGQAVENVYRYTLKLVTEIRIHRRSNSANAWYSFHKASGWFHQDYVFESLEAVKKEIKLRRIQDMQDMKRDLKIWRRRQKELRDW